MVSVIGIETGCIYLFVVYLFNDVPPYPQTPLQTGVDNRERAPTPATDFDQNFMKERRREQEGKTELDEEKLGNVKSVGKHAELQT